jgi:hypothetical protein
VISMPTQNVQTPLSMLETSGVIVIRGERTYMSRLGRDELMLDTEDEGGES